MVDLDLTFGLVLYLGVVLALQHGHLVFGAIHLLIESDWGGPSLHYASGGLLTGTRQGPDHASPCMLDGVRSR